MAAADLSQGSEPNDLRQYELSDAHSTQSGDPLTYMDMTASTLSPLNPPVQHSSLGDTLYGSLPITAHMAQSSDPGQARAIPRAVMDTTGQIPLPGMNPRVMATLWEDEGSLCFQVEAKGEWVARRQDNHFINGTKLLNVAGMSRGRRDGILKSEKTRHVAKIGPMQLQGVWIPFERALDLANKEQITELLYPLFVHNIGALLYNPNAPRTKNVVKARLRRPLDSTDSTRTLKSAQPDQYLHRHHSMQAPSTHPGPGQHYDAPAHDDSEEDKSPNPSQPSSSIPKYTDQPLLENTVIDLGPSQAANVQALGFEESEIPETTQKPTPPQVITSAANAEAHGASFATLSPSQVASSVFTSHADPVLRYESTTDQESADVLHINSPATVDWPSGSGDLAFPTLGFLLTQELKTRFSRWNESSETKAATSTDIISRPTVQRTPSSIYDTTWSPQEQISALNRTRLGTGCFTCRERHLKCDGRRPNCQNCTKSGRRCRRGVRLNFIDIDGQPVLLPVISDWKVRFQDESRAVASDYQGGSEQTRIYHEPSSDTNRASPATSTTSTEDGIVSRSANVDKTIAVCSRVLISAYARMSDTNHSPPTETCGADGPKTASKTGSKGQQQGSRSSQNLRKRRRADDDGSADEGNDRGKRFQRSEIEPPKGYERPLACPFNKFDNRLFGPDSPDEAYHSCATGSFVNIAHVKQHLRRNHYLPKHYCYRCCRQDFASDSMVAAHLREEPICMKVEPPLYRERIGPDFIEELSLERKNTPGTGREEYWHRVYNTFFPGAANRRPVTPYYEGPVAEHLEQFLRFSYGVVGDLWAAVQRRADAPAVADQADMVSICHDILQQAGQRYLEDMASSAMPTLGRLLQGEEASVRGAAPLDRQSHPAEEDPQRPGCHGRADGPPSIATTESQDTGSSLTTASDISSPAFPRTPQEMGATEHHRLQSTALVGQVQPLPAQFLETGCGSHAAHAEDATFSQCWENDSLQRRTGDHFDPPLQLPRDFSFDWDTEFDQMTKVNMDEWDSSLQFDGASFGRVD